MGLDSLPGSFVGRALELAQLDNGLAAAIAGHGRLFLLSGEPGIGKTRLAEQFAAQASLQGMRVMWGRCWEGGGAPAYWPIIQIIRACAERADFAQVTEALGAGIAQLASLVPEIVRPLPMHAERAQSERLDPETARFQLFDAVATLLKSLARHEPLVLVIDDLHDADVAALQMLRFLNRALKESPVLVVGTHREAEVERSPELRTLFGEIARDSIQFSLRGLSLHDAAALVRDGTGVELNPKTLATLHQTTAGNPLFLHGVVQMLIAEGKLEQVERLTRADLRLPGNVQSAILRRLSTLPERTNSFLGIASALGIDFDCEPLRLVAGAPDFEILDSLDEAIAAGILATAGSGGHYVFTHSLIRGAIYDRISTAERARLHRQIGEVLEKLHRVDRVSHLEELAHHFRLGAPAGDIAKAIDYSVRAAVAADNALAYEQSVAHLEGALQLTNGKDPDSLATKASLLSRLAGAAGMTGRIDGATISYTDRAIVAYQTLGDVEREAHARAELGVQLARGDDEFSIDIPRASDELARAEAVLGARGGGHKLAYTRMGVALACWMNVDIERGLAAADDTIRLSSPGQRTWTPALYFRAVHLLYQGRVAESFAQMDQAESDSRRFKGLLPRFRWFYFLGNLRLWTWQPAEATRLWTEGIDVLGIAPQSLQYQMLSWCRGLAAVRMGDLEPARRHLHSGSRMLLDGQIAFYAGEWDRAEQVLTRGAECMRQTGARALLCDYLFWSSRVMRQRGDLIHAEAQLRQGTEIASSSRAQLLEMQFLPELASLCVEIGRPTDARAYIQRCRDIMGGGEDWFGLEGHVALAEAEFAAAQREFDAAREHFRRAQEIFRRFSMPWEQARTLVAWAKACTETHDGNIAHDKIEEALAIYRRHGAGESWIESLASGCDRMIGSRTAVLAAHIFRKHGDYWTISFGDTDFDLKDAKGLHYIAHLLGNPGKEVAAIDLAALTAGGDSDPLRSTIDLGDAGEVLDSRSRTEYRRRLAELREEIERAGRMNDIGATERAQAEYEALTAQLAAAAGFRGRARRFASHRERARVAVTRSIRAAIVNIRRSNASLGRHLAKNIRTGHFCCYVQAEPIPSWQF